MASIQGIYVALFGRPADPKGLAYFDSVTSHGADLSAIGNLAGQSEYLSRFDGMSSAQIVNTIYQSLFNRSAEASGLDFWLGKLASGSLNVTDVAIAILDGASGTDAKTVSAKIAAADLFTQSLTNEQITAYSGIAATSQIRAYLARVDADHPGLVIDIASIAGQLTPASDPSGPSEPADVFTIGTDHLTSSDGSHVYAAKLGTGATLTANDSFHGAGNRIDITDPDVGGHDFLPAGVSLTGVGTLTLTTSGNAGDGTASFDLSGITGLTSFTLDASGNAGDYLKAGSGFAVTATTASSSLQLLGGASSVDITGTALTSLAVAGDVTGGVTLHHVAATSLSVDLNGVSLSGGLTDADNHITALTFSASASPSRIDAINDTALTSVTLADGVALGSDSTHLLALGAGVTTVAGASDNADNFIDLSASGATVGLGDGNNTIVLEATAASNSLSLGNGNNVVAAKATGADITVGSGYNTIDLDSHAATLHLGPDGNFDTDPLTPNQVIENATAGVKILFNNFSSIAFYVLENFTASSASDLIQHLEILVGGPRFAFAEQYAGNTYIVASATGVLGSTDTTVVELVGNHGINIDAGGHIFLIS